jgi:lysophospholipase L1-like esterase
MYPALGDSISIDDYAGGPGRGGASLLAVNDDENFPEWSGNDLRSRWPDLPFQMLATDGATSRTVLQEQVPRLLASPRRPTVVTLTAGGNDVLSCYGDTRAALDTVRTVTGRLSTILSRLESVTTGGGIVVVGTVYDPSDGTGDAARVGLPPWPDAVKVLEELNAVIRVLAGERGVRLADIHARFLGHGLSVGDPSQPSPRPSCRELWYCHVIEPNAWGASAVRAAFWEAITAPAAAGIRTGVEPQGA